MDLFRTLSFWIVKKWYGILVAQAVLFLAVYLAAWQVLEPAGIPETLAFMDCAYPFNTRVFWHLILTLAVSPLLASVLDALVRRRLWSSPEFMLKVEREFAAHLGNTRHNVFDAMRLPGAFHVLEAWYWTRDNRIDVTAAVRGRIVDGRLTVRADDSLGGDPGRGAVKCLSVRYLDGERIRERTVGENETLSLP